MRLEEGVCKRDLKEPPPHYGWRGHFRVKRDLPAALFMVRGGVLQSKQTSPLVEVRGGERFRGKRNIPSMLFEVFWGRFRGKSGLSPALFRIGKHVLEAKKTSLSIIKDWRGSLEAKGTSPSLTQVGGWAIYMPKGPPP